MPGHISMEEKKRKLDEMNSLGATQSQVSRKVGVFGKIVVGLLPTRSGVELVRVVRDNASLLQLIARDCQLDDNCAEALGQSLATGCAEESKLEVLDISRNPWSTRGVIWLFTHLTRIPEMKLKVLLMENQSFAQPYREEISIRDRSIDRGPAWFTALCSAIIMGMHFGAINSGALYYPGMMQTFDQPISVVCWLMTGQYAVACCFGPLYNRILYVLPQRITYVVAVLLTSVGTCSATFFDNYFAFMFFYTIIGGIGLGTSLVRVLSILADYFDRYRTLAIAVCLSGCGLFTFLYSSLIVYLVEQYTWRVTIMLMASIHLNLIPMMLILRPLPADSIPEAKVIVPEYPDLTTSQIGEDMETALFSSLLSMQSRNRRVFVQRPSDEYTYRMAPSRDIQAVIEFVKVIRDPDEPVHMIVSSISFLTEPGSLLIQQIEDAARDQLQLVEPFEQSHYSDIATILIPVVFLFGEPGLASMADELRRRYTLGEPIDPFTSSYLSGGLEVSQHTGIAPVYQSVFVADSFTSAMLLSHDSLQTRRSVREVITQAKQQVEKSSQEISSRGFRVHPDPIWTVIDQSELGENQTHWQNYGSDERVGVLGYFGPEEAPIPEVEEEIDAEDGDVPGARKILGTPFTPNRSREYNPTRRDSQQSVVSHITRPRRRSSTSRGRSQSLLGSTPRLPRGKFIVHGESQRGRESEHSVFSITVPDEAVEIFASKFEMKRTKCSLDQTEEDPLVRQFPRLLIADPVFLIFLISRFLAYMAESIVYGHLSNFALYLGMETDKAASLLSYIGIISMVSRLVVGLIAHFIQKIDVRALSGAGLLLVSSFFCLAPLHPTLPTLSAFAALYSLLISPSSAFAPVIAFQLVGAERYNDGVAYMLQFEALGYLIGGPIGGAIKEANNRYLDCFLFAAVAEFCSGAILIGFVIFYSPLFSFTGRRTSVESRTIEAQLDMEKEPMSKWAYASSNKNIPGISCELVHA